MIPIRQTSDNCMAACLASILEIPLWVVPDYQGIRRAGGSWLNALNVFLGKHHGVIYHEPERWLTTHLVPEGWHLINVGVPTDGRIDGGHAIVGYFGRPVWDPTGRRIPRPLRIDTWGILVQLTPELEATWRPRWGTCLCGACIRGLPYPAVAETRCIGCGCTQARACEGGCAWVSVDHGRGWGVCSSCMDVEAPNLEAAHA